MYYSQFPISLSDAARIVPALAAQEQHSSRSELYQHVPTIAVLAALQQQGFSIHGLQASRTRDESRRGFEKHMIRLRRHSDLRNVGDECPEIVVVNSHDGSCAYQLSAGVIRLICTNGCVVSDEWGSVKVKHHGAETIRDVIEGTFTVVSAFDTVMDNVEALKQVSLDIEEQELFAKKAHLLRFVQEDKAPVTPLMLLRGRRAADHGDTLWKTYNKVQENITQGGLKGRRVAADGKIRRTTLRAVTGIDGSLNLNKALWALTEDTAASKGIKLLAPPSMAA